MELLVEAFTQKIDWDREKFLQTRPNNASLALISLSRFPLPDQTNSDTMVYLNPEDYAYEAASRLRETYPDFTMQVARETGLIDLYI